MANWKVYHSLLNGKVFEVWQQKMEEDIALNLLVQEDMLIFLR